MNNDEAENLRRFSYRYAVCCSTAILTKECLHFYEIEPHVTRREKHDEIFVVEGSDPLIPMGVSSLPVGIRRPYEQPALNSMSCTITTCQKLGLLIYYQSAGSGLELALRRVVLIYVYQER